MGATTKRYDTTPADTSRLRGGVVDYLMGGSKPSTGQSGFGTQGNGTGSPYDRINSATTSPTSSIDKLGGADSEFFKNMLARLQPAFDQQRQLAIAGANEGSGTLTGSGFANRLGTSVGRSLVDSQNVLTGYATHGLDLEAARQEAQAQRDQSVHQSNAANFLQLLLGQSLAGVGPDTIKTSGGIGALLGPIASLFGTYMGSRGPSSGAPGGGGGGTIAPPYTPPSNVPIYAYRG